MILVPTKRSNTNAPRPESMTVKQAVPAPAHAVLMAVLAGQDVLNTKGEIYSLFLLSG